MKDRVGIEALSGLGMPPVAFVSLAADLGVHNISLSLRPRRSRSGRNLSYDIGADAMLRRELNAVLRDRNVAVSLGEGCVLTDEEGAKQLADRIFEPMLELGIGRINIVSLASDLSYTLDEMARLVDLALDAGFLHIVTEFAPVLTLQDLPAALAALDYVNRPELQLLIDTMHLARSGGTPFDLAALDPAKVGYVQLSDAPLSSEQPYMDEAMTNRLAPGEGELSLLPMLAALPRDVIVSLELPQLAKLDAGLSIEQILRPAVNTTRSYLTLIDQH